MKKLSVILIIAAMLCCLISCKDTTYIPYDAYTPKESEATADTGSVTEKTTDTYPEETNSNPYKDKKIGWIGDSIVYGLTPSSGSLDRNDRVSFANMTAVALEMTIINDGVSGSTIAKSKSNTVPMSERYMNLDADCDIIVVSGGTNDFDRAVPLGSTDNSTNDTFYGALKILCEGLKSRYPEKLIIFSTPIKRADTDYPAPDSVNAQGKTLKEYGDAITEVCNIYSIPVLDLYAESGLNPVSESQNTIPGSQTKMFSDGLHPTRKGHELISQYVIEYFKNLPVAD